MSTKMYKLAKKNSKKGVQKRTTSDKQSKIGQSIYRRK